VTDVELEAIHQTFHRLEQRWNVLPIPDNSVWHAYDPLPTTLFLSGLARAAELTEGRRFLDVGCGIGRNLALAHCLGWQVAGIERHEPYLDAAAELLPEATLVHADALSVEVFDADCVYLYRPARGDELAEILERHVLARLPVGTVCFFPLRRAPEVWVV
jgi:SAM-dependent methyltransferase